MYKLLKLPDGSFQDCIFRTTDNSFIPKLDNSPDYEEYLKWLAEGNTPEPADE